MTRKYFSTKLQQNLTGKYLCYILGNLKKKKARYINISKEVLRQTFGDSA